MADQPETSLTEDLAEAMAEHDVEEEEVEQEEQHEEQEAATPEAEETEIQKEPESTSESDPEPAEQQAEPDKPEDAAPIDWSPTEKEEWKNTPEVAKKAIQRREVEHNNMLQQTTESRRIADQFVRTVEPFRALMAAEGVQDPFQAVQGLMQTTAQLRMGSPEQKAQSIAGLIKHYGVDISTLDSTLAGEAPQQQAGQMQDPRVDQLVAHINQQQQQQQHQTNHQATQTVEAFVADPKNEFANGLRMQIADEIDMAGNNGENIDLNTAYERAVWKNPEIRGIMMQRHDQEVLGTGNMMGKKNAASSISGKRGAVSQKTTDDMSMREMIAAQFGDESRI